MLSVRGQYIAVRWAERNRPNTRLDCRDNMVLPVKARMARVSTDYVRSCESETQCRREVVRQLISRGVTSQMPDV